MLASACINADANSTDILKSCTDYTKEDQVPDLVFSARSFDQHNIELAFLFQFSFFYNLV